MSISGTVIAVVAIVTWGIVRLKHGHPLRDRRFLHGSYAAETLEAPRESEMEKELEQLRERVRVLERIATEERHSRAIADEIESLRGK